MNAHLEPPTLSVQFLAQVVRTDVTLHIWESIAGMSQVWGAPLEALRWNPPPPILAHMVGGGYH